MQVTVLAMGRGRIMLIGSCNADDFSDIEFADERENCMERGSCANPVYAEKRMMLPDKVAERRQVVPRVIIFFSLSLSLSSSLDMLCE